MKDENKRIVRIYHYADPYKGWGDGGTIGFIRLDESDIDKTEEETFDGKDTFISERMNESGRQKVMDEFSDEADQGGYPNWGWENSSIEEMEAELNKLKSLMKRYQIK